MDSLIWLLCLSTPQQKKATAWISLWYYANFLTWKELHDHFGDSIIDSNEHLLLTPDQAPTTSRVLEEATFTNYNPVSDEDIKLLMTGISAASTITFSRYDTVWTPTTSEKRTMIRSTIDNP